MSRQRKSAWPLLLHGLLIALLLTASWSSASCENGSGSCCTLGYQPVQHVTTRVPACHVMAMTAVSRSNSHHSLCETTRVYTHCAAMQPAVAALAVPSMPPSTPIAFDASSLVPSTGRQERTVLTVHPPGPRYASALTSLRI